MSFENTWVGYLQRGYKSIKASILSRLEILVPEITDRSESNIFVILIESFSGLVEQLNYYIDSMARELYLPTARRYSSLVKISRLLDYRVMAKVGSTVDLVVTAVDSGGDPYAVIADISIPAGSVVETTSGVEFMTTENRTIFTGTSSVSIPSIQRSLSSNNNIGTTTSAANQAFKLGTDYQHDTLQITINSITWELRKTFAFSGPQDKHFIVEVNELKEAWVIFGDNVNGQIPPSGNIVYATYYECDGLSGNVADNTITTWVSGKPSGGGASDYEVTNPLAAAGGLDVEGIEGVRKHAPLSLRTLDRAVTLQDYEDIALLVPGVGKVSVGFNANKKAIEIYIAPDGGGIASSALLTSVEDFFEGKKTITTSIDAVPCGETPLRMTLDVTAKFRRSTSDTAFDVVNALSTYFGFNYSDINKSIRKSDIIAVVDNLDKVDYLTLSILTTKPYPRILLGNNEIAGTWHIEVTNLCTTKTRWRLAITSTTSRTVRLYKTDPSTGIETFDKSWVYPLTDPGLANVSSANGSINLAIWGSGFAVGDSWSFTTYPYNEDIELDDHTIPIATSSEMFITVYPQIL